MIVIRGRFFTPVINFFCVLILSLNLAEASLKPKEIVVLVNAASSESNSIGELYINLRKIPSHHLIKVRTPIKEWISRKDYDELIAGPVRKSINSLHDEGAKIRCIVTTYGVPLKIAAIEPLITGDLEIYVQLRNQKNKVLANLRKKKRESKDTLEELNKKINKLRSEINKLNFKIGQLNASDTLSAVDSELTLVLAPDYSLSGSLQNPKYLAYRGRAPIHLINILMVSRLDAPKPELAKGLVRTAIEVEHTGLKGKVYLDARGKTGTDDYGMFDQDIRKTAQVLQKSSMPVILDNRPALFQKGDAPEAALYCGWYSLGRYVNAFEWSRGAIGYHVASSEAVSLHQSKARYWVKSMIEEGVIGTLGPVSEPYLHAFPPPSLFFPLLMSGNYTLMEVFAMSNPLISWRIILIGDPLYNPFKKNPAIYLKDLPPPPD